MQTVHLSSIRTLFMIPMIQQMQSIYLTGIKRQMQMSIQSIPQLKALQQE